MEYQDEPKREFKGIFIPAEIWLNTELSVNEKVLYAEIDSFTSNDKSCFISNKHISDLLNVTETNASKSLNSLIQKGLVEVTKFDGRRRYVKTTLYKNDKADLSKTTRQTCQKQQYTIPITNPINNEGEKPLSTSRISYDEIQKLWNTTCTSLSKISVINTDRQEKIRCRWKEFQKVGEPMEILKTLFSKLQASNWITKESRANWRKNCFNWLFENSENWVKVYEGNYDDTQQSLFPTVKETKYDDYGHVIKDGLE